MVARLTAHGGTRVAAHDPYWDEHGATLAAPDGYRLVLCSHTWEQARGLRALDGVGLGSPCAGRGGPGVSVRWTGWARGLRALDGVGPGSPCAGRGRSAVSVRWTG
ncbi:hypothetical protein ACIRTB_11855 [Streptomyces sp. NPDC101158]|uniref:hypothetical protein n=1 Tax=Streptomyces sp. NPDC101158 TaxID=3366117 RepID=UPI00380D4525